MIIIICCFATILLIGIMLFCVFTKPNIMLSENMKNKKIGKDLVIIIPEGMVVDNTYLYNVKNGSILHNKPFFNFIDDVEYEKLVNYMKKNNLVITPGKYTINQAWSAEKIIEHLKFSEK